MGRRLIGEAGSRFHEDFRVIRVIGRGGHGAVVKAWNKLDRRVYAVKRVPLKRNEVNDYKNVLREVVTLSRVAHPHIVRYHQVIQLSNSSLACVTNRNFVGLARGSPPL